MEVMVKAPNGAKAVKTERHMRKPVKKAKVAAAVA
jgi:hypothetical protein